MKDWRFLFEKFILRQHKPGERAVLELMKRQRGDLFVDIGANRGIYSKLMEGRFARIISFEPYFYPEYEPTYHYALSEYDGDNRPFYVSSGNGSADTLLKDFTYKPDPNYSGVVQAQIFRTDNIRQVQVRRYDSVIHEVADLVKIDVEGAEFSVLRGMTGALPRKIVLELHDTDRTNELLNWFSNHNYTWKLIDSHPHLFAER